MTTVPEYFGSLVFDTRVMKARLSGDVYRSLKQTIQKGAKLDPTVADAVASAMKDWAVEHGATHFTHWFQPMTGITAEKHDSFISPAPDGRVTKERTFVYQDKVRSFFIFGGKNAIIGRNTGKKRLYGAPERSGGLHRCSFSFVGLVSGGILKFVVCFNKGRTKGGHWEI